MIQIKKKGSIMMIKPQPFFVIYLVIDYLFFQLLW